ncbi:MAG: hypothetical protein OEY52_09035 [Gammaproteobacteria bacterium]|nr:hypothetical protein [Gammaproteobacteria bacterium]
MTQQNNTPDWQDDDLTKLYRHAHQEQPEAESDQAILNAAQKYCEKPSRKSLSTSWAVPLATAASLVLVANLVWFNYDWQSKELPKFEEEHFTSTAKSDVQELAEHKKAPAPQRRENLAATRQREEQPLLKEFSKEKRSFAKQRLHQNNTPEPMTSQLAAPSKSQVVSEGLADTYGMDRAVNNFYVQHLANQYQVVDGRHFISADINRDGLADWVGLMMQKEGSIDLLAIISQRQTHQYMVLDKNVVIQEQLKHSDVRLSMDIYNSKKTALPVLILTLPNKITFRYYWNGRQFDKDE